MVRPTAMLRRRTEPRVSIDEERYADRIGVRLAVRRAARNRHTRHDEDFIETRDPRARQGGLAS